MEPISILIDAFMQLVDKLVNLEKVKYQDKKALFAEIIKPLFDELEPIALKYVDFFRNARKDIIEIQNFDVLDLTSHLNHEREALVAARIKVRAMSDQINECIKDEDASRFANAVGNLFNAPPLPDDLNDVLSKRRELFEQQLSGAPQALIYVLLPSNLKNVRQSSLDFIDDVLKQFELSWNEIVQSYERLKIYSLASPRLVRKPRTKKKK